LLWNPCTPGFRGTKTQMMYAKNTQKDVQLMAVNSPLPTFAQSKLHSFGLERSRQETKSEKCAHYF
jgi:hypothetical protein